MALLLDEDPCHTAKKSQELAAYLGMKLLWLPKRCPELNPMDHLWGKAKQIISANLQRPTIDEHVNDFLEYLTDLAPQEALRAAGLLSNNCWLKSVL